MANVTREPAAVREPEPVPPGPEGPAKKTLRFPRPSPCSPRSCFCSASAPEGEQCVDTSAGPNEAGFLYGSAPIFLFVLAVGAFITVTMKAEAIQTGIGRSRSW